MSTDNVIVTLTVDNPACHSAAAQKCYEIAIGQGGVTIDGVKKMLAVAMAAILVERQVDLNFSDATPNCYVNRFLCVEANL